MYKEDFQSVLSVQQPKIANSEVSARYSMKVWGSDELVMSTIGGSRDIRIFQRVKDSFNAKTCIGITSLKGDTRNCKFRDTVKVQQWEAEDGRLRISMAGSI